MQALFTRDQPSCPSLVSQHYFSQEAERLIRWNFFHLTFPVIGAEMSI